MLAILQVTFPFFALIGAGYLAARRRLLPLEAIAGLNTFVLYFALPCMLYRFGAGTPIGQLLDGSVALLWCLAALALVALVTWFSRRRLSWNDSAFGALVAVFPNTGFMGVPLLTALLGAAAAGPAIITIMIDMLLTTSLCLALSRLDAGEHGGAGRAARNALRGMLGNPMPWSILLGALASALQWRLPGPADRTVAMLADAAAPAALFTIGAVLARQAVLTGRHRESAAVGAALGGADSLTPPAAAWRDVLPVVAVKLLVHPLLVLALGQALIAGGLPLAPSALAVLVLAAALPSASNVSMLAERLGADNARVARIILWTTVVAFVTFPVAVAWMR